MSDEAPPASEMNHEWMVADEDRGQRLDRFIVNAMQGPSRSRVQDWIREGHVTLNDQPCQASDSLKPGQIVRLGIPATQATSLEAEDLPIRLLWQDRDLAVIDKASGMTVHPGAGRATGTLVNALLHHLPDLSGIGGVERPGIVHRLDRETSGVMVVAKNDAAHTALSAQFAARETIKIYQALVDGVPRQTSGSIDQPIGRHPVHRQKMAIHAKGRPARTDYNVLEAWSKASRIQCRLHSGRTHQIRVHMKSIGHGLIGDTVYHPNCAHPAPRLMLHAMRLEFRHPINGEWLAFEAPIPDDFEGVARHLAETI